MKYGFATFVDHDADHVLYASHAESAEGILHVRLQNVPYSCTELQFY